MAIIILSTCPDLAIAKDLATKLIEAKLAACVNIIPGIAAIYRWQDKIISSEEVMLVIKTTNEAYDPVSQFILTHHPYDCPEVVALPLQHGLPGYLQWLVAQVQIT